MATAECKKLPTLREYLVKYGGKSMLGSVTMTRCFRIAFIKECENGKVEDVRNIFPQRFEDASDFQRLYGLIHAGKLDGYYVAPDSDNYDLTLMNKKAYDEKHSPVTIDGEAHAIMLDFMQASEDVLAGDYPILDCGSGLDVLKEFTARINALTTRQKNKIRSIFLGHKYTKNKKED